MQNPSRTQKELLEENALLKRKIRKLEKTKSSLPSDDLLMILADHMPDIIFSTDADGRVTQVGGPVSMGYGYRQEQWIGKPFPDFVHPDDREQTIQLFSNYTKERDKRKTGFEFRGIARDGSVHWFEMNSLSDFDRRGRYTGEKGVLRDITRRKEAEAALRASEERIRLITENLVDCISFLDGQGRYLYVTPSYTRAFGYAPEEMIGKNAIDFIHPDNVEQTRRLHKKAMEAMSELTYETMVRHKDGRYIPVEVTGRVLTGLQGEIIGGIISARDISERRKLEQARREAEERYRFIAENTADLVTIRDMNHRIIYVSPNVHNFLGYSMEEIMREESLSRFTSPETLKLLTTAWQEEFQMEASGTADPQRKRIIEGEAVRKDGSRIWVERTMTFLRDKDRKPCGVMTVGRDFTERKKAEQALRDSEALYRLLAENMTDVVWLTDVDGHFIYVSPSTEKISGFSEEELKKRTLQDYLSLSTLKTAEAIFKEEIDKIKSDPSYSGKRMLELEIAAKSGAMLWLECTIGILRDETGKPSRILGEARDITLRKRAEEEKVKLQDQLIQAQKMESVGRLAGGVAHDFNNMLGVILGRVDIAMMQIDQDHPLYTGLKEIKRAAERSAALTKQLLAFARRQTVSPKVLDLNQTLEGMLKMLQRLIGEDIKLIWMPHHNLWPVKIDQFQVDQVVANLCVNARDAIDGVGAIIIKTRNITIDAPCLISRMDYAPGDYVLLSVSDTGCGMDKDTQSKLFEPFFTTKTVGKGTGLGLAMIYGIVQQNSGFIHVTSERGHGTTMNIYLPRYSGAPEKPGIEESPTFVIGGNETILLVEDEPDMLKVCRHMLETMGYRVLSAEAPAMAIRQAEDYSDEIHLLLTDVILPEMNGRDLFNQLFGSHPHLKCLFMSGYTADIIAHHGVLDEGVSFIEKPFTQTDLAAKVRTALNSK